MNSITQMNNIMDEMIASGVTPKVTVLRSQKGPKKSLYGVKSNVSGKNRRGQVAHGVGKMRTEVITSGKVMTNI